MDENSTDTNSDPPRTAPPGSLDAEQAAADAQRLAEEERTKVIRSEADLYTVDAARFDQNQRLLSLARLPQWEASDGREPVLTGHGWGYHLDSLLGQGLSRGELIGVAADKAGAGKTALVAQLIDGTVTRSLIIAQQGQPEEQWGNVVTPVVLFSEMDAQQLAWRSGARWLGVNSQVYRGGLSYLERLRTDDQRMVNDLNWKRLFRLLTPNAAISMFGEARKWWLKRVVLLDALKAMDRDSEEFGDILVGAMRDWMADLWGPFGDLLPTGTIVRPLLVIDPVQRSQQLDLTDVEALNRLARMLRTRAQQEGWVVIVTSDTNKASAIGTTKKETTAIEEASAAFRGSYGLIHELSTALYIRRPPTARDLKPLEVEVVIPKSRWGKQPRGTPDDPWPRFEWQPEYLRFVPLSQKDAVARAWLDQEANEAAKAKRGMAKKEADSGPGNDPLNEDA